MCRRHRQSCVFGKSRLAARVAGSVPKLARGALPKETTRVSPGQNQGGRERQKAEGGKKNNKTSITPPAVIYIKEHVAAWCAGTSAEVEVGESVDQGGVSCEVPRPTRARER